MKSNDILVIYGNTPKSMVKEVLQHVKIEDEISRDVLIGIKPNLVVAKPFNSGATTSPELVAGVIEYLQEKGYQKILILEGSWVGERTTDAFRVCGYEKLAQQYSIPLIDLQKEKYQEYDSGGMKLNICNKAKEVEYLINIPVLKGHCQTKMTCALKNLKGCIPNNEKRRFHSLGLHQPIAHLSKIIKQNLIIVDGMMGDLDFEEGGNPVQMNRIIVGRDPVLIDTYAAELMGYGLADIPYIQMAEKLGVGSTDLAKAVIVELNKDVNIKPLAHSRKVQQLAGYIEADKACSACYGSLIHALARLNEQGVLKELAGKICIGQGYKDQKCRGIGIGSCTKGFDDYLGGCPPKAKEIVEYIRLICKM